MTTRSGKSDAYGMRECLNVTLRGSLGLPKRISRPSLDARVGDTSPKEERPGGFQSFRKGIDYLQPSGPSVVAPTWVQGSGVGLLGSYLPKADAALKKKLAPTTVGAKFPAEIGGSAGCQKMNNETITHCNRDC